jgi:protein TonB
MEAGMLQTLIESRATRTPSLGESMLSVVVHAGIVGALIVATTHATVAHVTEARETAITFTPAPPPPIAPAMPTVFTTTPIAKGFTVLRAPIDIPTSIPTVDVSLPPTDPANFTGIGKPGGLGNGLEGATGVAPSPDGVFLATQVDRPVVMLPGSAGPAYPESLRAAGIDGSVTAQFVVDSTGRVDLARLTILESQHPLFSAAVRTALARMRYLPAEAGGARVAQLVQQTFQFTVRPH